MYSKAFLLLVFMIVPIFSFVACGGDSLDSSNMSLNLRPGVYFGVGEGYLGEMRISLEIGSDGNISDITLVSHNDTPGFAYPSFEIIRASVLRNQSLDIDLITGATYSPLGFIEAVEDALIQAGANIERSRQQIFTEQNDDMETIQIAEIDNALSEEAILALPLATATFNPGVYTATVPSFQDALMTVQAVFTNNQIVGVEVLEHGDSLYGSGWALRAIPAVPDQILVRQSTQNIDIFTGATITRDAVITAVDDMIVQAGANPAQLTPQTISEPLPGDRFIPGFIEVTVPANTMDIYGIPLAEGATRMLYSQDVDMNLRLSFGRNEFHLHSGGAFGLGQGGGGHGESVLADGEIGGGTLGGWWFRQVANHQVNDRQSTQGIDIATGATMSAAAILWGVEQGMISQGANPEDIFPIAYPPTRFKRNPAADPDAPFFVPGIYDVTVPGWGGPINARITLDRTTIRRIEVISHYETEGIWETVWGAEANHIIRDAIYSAGPLNLDEIDIVTGATVSSYALIDAVRKAMELAWVD